MQVQRGCCCVSALLKTARFTVLLRRAHLNAIGRLSESLQPLLRIRIVARLSIVPQQAQRIDETDAGFQLVYARRGVQFVRSYGAGPAADGAPLPHALAEALRMAAGLVRVGVETEASTLALEADLDDHCSTRKGCYTGQEIVARIHTYGHVNRKLCLLQLDGGERIEAPTTLLELEDELPVGRVMHAVSVPGHDLRVGLGYLPEDFQALGSKLKLEDGAAVEVCGFA